MHTLKGIGEIDAEDTEVLVDSGKGESDLVHFFAPGGAMAPKLIEGSGIGHTGREGVA
jgi:hypothetical protein